MGTTKEVHSSKASPETSLIFSRLELVVFHFFDRHISEYTHNFRKVYVSEDIESHWTAKVE